MMVCRLLLELALLVGCRESWQLQYQPARCLEMDHLGEGERARDKCYQPEREKRRERARALLSNNHLLPLSAIQGRNKIELISLEIFNWD